MGWFYHIEGVISGEIGKEKRGLGKAGRMVGCTVVRMGEGLMGIVGFILSVKNTV